MGRRDDPEAYLLRAADTPAVRGALSLFVTGVIGGVVTIVPICLILVVAAWR